MRKKRIGGHGEDHREGVDRGQGWLSPKVNSWLDTMKNLREAIFMSVQIHTGREGAATVVQLQGKVDATSAPSVEQTLLGAIDQGEKKVVILKL